MHADRTFAERIPHGCGEFDFDVVLVHDPFQTAVDGRHLIQAEHRQRDHQRQYQRKTGAHAKFHVSCEHLSITN